MSEVPARYVLTVDVEDYFHVEAFSGVVSRDSWDSYTPRVEANTRRVLALLDRHGAKATFFVLGWVARKFPALVREIRDAGHEIGCHSFWHQPVYSQTPEEFRQDLLLSVRVIEDAAGVRPVGYRAPSWSITERSLWALDILSEEGFEYDSSIYPISHDLYGIPGAERFPNVFSGPGGAELTEFPPATVRWQGTNFPAAGGGWLRILPFWYTRRALRSIAAEDGRAIVVYFHPWELDPDQPRIAAPLKSRFRHYTNLGRMERRIEALLGEHRFEPFRAVLGSARQRSLAKS